MLDQACTLHRCLHAQYACRRCWAHHLRTGTHPGHANRSSWLQHSNNTRCGPAKGNMQHTPVACVHLQLVLGASKLEPPAVPPLDSCLSVVSLTSHMALPPMHPHLQPHSCQPGLQSCPASTGTCRGREPLHATYTPRNAVHCARRVVVAVCHSRTHTIAWEQSRCLQ